MNKLDTLYSELTMPTSAKLVLLVLDGIGDLSMREAGHLTPLEAAVTPELDELTQNSAQGRIQAVAPGVTPGSSAGHLALFGYDPLDYQVGRGVMEALGMGVELKPGDVAARGNFCTLAADGTVSDRRAGRIETAECERLCSLLTNEVKSVGDVEVIIQHGWGHRFVVVFRGKGLAGSLSDTDPLRDGGRVVETKPLPGSEAGAEKAAAVVARFTELASSALKNEAQANGVLLRGISQQAEIPTFQERYSLRAASLALFPMYKGLARVVGMNNEDGPKNIGQQFERYLDIYDDYDFFFIHYKYPDFFGADGNFEAKKQAIEDLDEALPILMKKRPDVLAITGDHSTPCSMKGPSWHPAPVLLNSPFSGSDKLDRFTETSANLGSLGVLEGKYLIRLMQANARMFDRFGA